MNNARFLCVMLSRGLLTTHQLREMCQLLLPLIVDYEFNRDKIKFMIKMNVHTCNFLRTTH